MAKVTGLGGMFYKVADPEKTRAWYQETLGVGGPWGAMFPFKNDDPEGFTLLTPVNDDREGMVSDLEAKGVEILARQDESYGRFAWILDPDGVKVELWQQLGAAP